MIDPSSMQTRFIYTLPDISDLTTVDPSHPTLGCEIDTGLKPDRNAFVRVAGARI